MLELQVEVRYMKDTIQILKVFWNKTEKEAADLAQKMMSLEKQLSIVRL